MELEDLEFEVTCPWCGTIEEEWQDAVNMLSKEEGEVICGVCNKRYALKLFTFFKTIKK